MDGGANPIRWRGGIAATLMLICLYTLAGAYDERTDTLPPTATAYHH